MPGERVVLGHVDLDVQVTRGAAAGADLALLAELHPRSVVDPGRDLHGQRPPGADPAFTGALAARVRDHRAEAAAGRARPQGADLAEERALHMGHLALPVAGLARHRVRARRGALAVAGRADHSGVDLDLAGDPERRLRQVDLEPDQRVLAAAYPRPRSAALRAAHALAAEERVHDVGEREARALAEAGGPAERVAAAVVRRPLLRVREHLVGARDLLEVLLRLRIGVDVGVVLPREPPVGLLDGVGVRVAGHTEEVVQVLAQRASFCIDLAVMVWFVRWLVGGLRPRRGSGRRSGPRPAPLPSCRGSPSWSGRRCRGWRPPRRAARSRWRPRWSPRAPRPGPPPRSGP